MKPSHLDINQNAEQQSPITSCEAEDRKKILSNSTYRTYDT